MKRIIYLIALCLLLTFTAAAQSIIFTVSMKNPADYCFRKQNPDALQMAILKSWMGEMH